MATIALGHAAKHWYISAFAVFLPLLEREYALSSLGVAMLVTIRQVGSGLPNFFVGYVADRFRGHWHVLLPITLFGAASAIAMAGIMPWIWPLAACIALAGGIAVFWHPPAISMLSLRFPSRRGLAIAFHGAGSGGGEAFGPLGVGLILTVLLADHWRVYAVASLVPAGLIAVLLYWMLKGAAPPVHTGERRSPKVADLFGMLRYPAYRTLTYANFSRSFAHFGLLAFLPIYLARDLNMDSAGVGAHIALLTLLGIVAGPVFGYFSDRTGRRPLIVIAMLCIAGGLTAMAVAGHGIGLVAALGVTGIFLWSVQDIINAAAMDAAPKGAEGTVVGLMFSSSFLGGIAAPIVAGLLVTATGTRASVFYLSAVVMAPVALVCLLAPLHRKDEPRESARV